VKQFAAAAPAFLRRLGEAARADRRNREPESEPRPSAEEPKR